MRQEDPAAFLAAFERAGIGEDANMARYARLALAEDLRELADRKLHRAQQREDPQPRRVGESLQQVGERQRVHVQADIKKTLYVNEHTGHRVMVIKFTELPIARGSGLPVNARAGLSDSSDRPSPSPLMGPFREWNDHEEDCSDRCGPGARPGRVPAKS